MHVWMPEHQATHVSWDRSCCNMHGLHVWQQPKARNLRFDLAEKLLRDVSAEDVLPANPPARKVGPSKDIACPCIPLCRSLKADLRTLLLASCQHMFPQKLNLHASDQGTLVCDQLWRHAADQRATGEHTWDVVIHGEGHAHEEPNQD